MSVGKVVGNFSQITYHTVPKIHNNALDWLILRQVLKRAPWRRQGVAKARGMTFTLRNRSRNQLEAFVNTPGDVRKTSKILMNAFNGSWALLKEVDEASRNELGTRFKVCRCLTD
uniref:Uncharacterized protein n=1 Tax=Tanacetum cinerariifolium TaxID=118510 RepID=A0A699IFH3_TANCI|nr:hypothetical protein [Tanacetum cinerariifolium]